MQRDRAGEASGDLVSTPAVDVMLRECRLELAGRIADAIERAAPCPPPGHCEGRRCEGCVRHAQAVADALIARRAGEAGP
jgi:hypothetical protein